MDGSDKDDAGSWKSQLGLEAEASDGMASNPAIQQIYIGRTRSILSQF